MRIVLAKCPRAYSSHFQENSESLALAYLAASLRRAGYREVLLLDGSLTRLSVSEIAGRIMKLGPDLVGFTISDSTFLESTFQCAAQLRRLGSRSHIILGGYTPSFQHRETLFACDAIDSVCRFEGEETIVDLARALEERRDWRKVTGIAYRGSGSVVTTPLRRALRNLDELPFPSRDNVLYVIENMPETGVVGVSGSRGCYADCSFCSIRAFYDAENGPPIRFRSPKNIADEIELLVHTYGWSEIQLVDDVFVVPGQAGMHRLTQFVEEFRRRQLRVMLSISERACNIVDETCVMLREMGVRQILIGIEAGSDDLLNYYNKRTTIRQNQHAIELLQSMEIDPAVSFINFSPATTLEQLRQNLDFLLRLRVNFLQGLLNRFQIYPGTPLGEDILRSGRFVGKFPKYDYIPDDPRTDTIYKIVSQSCGLFLTTAFELKRIERQLRRLLFKTEDEGARSVRLREARNQFQRLQQSIMEDAGRLFRYVLDSVEAGSIKSDAEVLDCVLHLRNAVRHHFGIWHSQLAFFETFHPDLSRSDRCIESDSRAWINGLHEGSDHVRTNDQNVITHI